MEPDWIVVVGASAGGLAALKTLLADLPADLPAAVFITLHRAAIGADHLPAILNRRSHLPVVAAVDGAPIRTGEITLAPPDRHLVLTPGRIRVTYGPRENLARPAIDPLFRSAALAYRHRVIGVILTGMQDDGTAGLAAVKALGGLAIVQDPADAEHPSMPESALTYVAVDAQVALHELGPLLCTVAASEPAETGARPMDTESERELRLETEIAMGAAALNAGVLTLGSPTTLTCPECHGVLLRVGTSKVVRFRCHTGHAYSFQTLLDSIRTATEDALWNALRVIEEGLLITTQTATPAPDHQVSRAALITQAQQRATLVRQALLVSAATSPFHTPPNGNDRPQLDHAGAED